MPQHVTDAILHFAGYIHLPSVLGYTPIHYTGAPVYRSAPYTPPDPRGADAAKRLPPDEQSAPVQLPDVPLERHSDYAVGARAEFNAIPQSSLFGDLVLGPEFEAPIVPLQGSGSLGPVPGPFDLKIALTYNVGPTYMADLAAEQINVMFDLDAMLGAAAVNGIGAPAVPLSTIEAMIGEVEALIPASVIPLDRPDGLDAEFALREGRGEPRPIDTDGTSEAQAQPVDETSEHVNGVRVDTPDAPLSAVDVIADQSAELSAALARFDEARSDDAGTEGDAPPPPVTEPGPHVATPGSVEVTTYGTPTGGYAQEAVTGENKSLNVAVLDDRSDELSSIVIRGDLHETNAIVEINALVDDDVVDIASDEIVQTIAASENSVTNMATFVADPGIVFGDGVTGFSGALNWNVTYVNGDYWNIAALSQRNLIIDGDLLQHTTVFSHSTAVLGANQQLNFAELNQGSASYDLIVIGGNYYDFNTIVQINLVYDNDVMAQLLGGDGSQTASFNGNILKNDAAIVGVGSEDFKPLTDDVKTLADAIADKKSELEIGQALGIPGNGSDQLNVLYVHGNYYDLDLIVQTNVIVDADVAAQLAPGGAPAESFGDEPDGLQQAASAGSNEATNLALIIDVDSLSGYQYLGGSIYEETMLVQANIVSDDDEIATGSDLHPDVVAAIAAMGEVHDPADCECDQPGYSQPTHTSDLMGSVMS